MPHHASHVKFLLQQVIRINVEAQPEEIVE
jgi:hypothetical protein